MNHSMRRVVHFVFVAYSLFVLSSQAQEGEKISVGSRWMAELDKADKLDNPNYVTAVEIGLTWGYLRGAADSYPAIVMSLGHVDCENAFKPSALSNEQLVLLVKNWMRDNPTTWDRSRMFYVMSAFSEAYPCYD